SLGHATGCVMREVATLDLAAHWISSLQLCVPQIFIWCRGASRRFRDVMADLPADAPILARRLKLHQLAPLPGQQNPESCCVVHTVEHTGKFRAVKDFNPIIGTALYDSQTSDCRSARTRGTVPAAQIIG